MNIRRVLVIALLAAGCGGSVPSVVPSNVSACAAALVSAAGVDQNADSVSDLYPAIRACGSLAEWSAAFHAVNGAGFTGTAAEVLTNACLAAEVKAEPLCSAVAAP